MTKLNGIEMMDFSAMKVTCSNSEKFHTNKQKNQSCLSVNSAIHIVHLHVGSVKWFENAFTWAYVNLWFKKTLGF